MKIILLINLLLYNYGFSQTEPIEVKSFVNDILLNENYDMDLYQKYIHYYNGHLKTNNKEFEKYLTGIKLYTLHSITKEITNKNDVKIIDLTNNKDIIKKYIRDDYILPSYSIYGVFEKEKFITHIILDDKGNIISFLTALNKNAPMPSHPFLLNVNL